MTAKKNNSGIEGQRYVRVTKVVKEKYVEFEFSIEDPTIHVELVLPFEHFKKFCKTNDVKHLSPEQEAAVEYDKLKWRFGAPGFDEETEND
ncbi:phenol hydroxylase [Cycloclasticus sp. 44_32_T64]|nr:phenol hydroxylase [Cycloclasticus sp. 44_32_T64]